MSDSKFYHEYIFYVNFISFLYSIVMIMQKKKTPKISPRFLIQNN